MESQLKRFTFLQLSDVHLDSRFLSGRLGLSHSQRYERNNEMLLSLYRALEEAARRRVDAIFIPGDLFDADTVTGPTINYLIESFSRLGDIPVVIAPGNRDYYSFASPYNPKVLQARGLPPWPDNVIVFDADAFQTIRHPLREDVCFIGRAFQKNEVEPRRLLNRPVALRTGAPLNFFVHHGFLEGYAGPDAEIADKYSAPFSVEELESQAFTYAALGHCHEFAEVYSSRGKLIGAYGGSFVGRSFEEAGPRLALFGTVIVGPSRVPECTVEPYEFDNRRIYVAGVDVSGLSEDVMAEEIGLAIQEQGARTGEDIVYLHMEGSYPPEADKSSVVERFRDNFFHVRVADHTRPDYLSERFDERTTEGKFIEAMLEYKRRVEKGRTEAGLLDSNAAPDSVSGGTAEDALYYGLDALRRQKVDVRNVD
jgi:DNA repair exonuclease SbcCD nuclease subunit